MGSNPTLSASMNSFHRAERESLAPKDARLEEARGVVDSFATIGRDEKGVETRVAVDPQLREILALLLALGMHPEQSCWGHPERASGRNLIGCTPEITLTGQLPDREYTSAEAEAAGAEADEDARRLETWLREFYQQRSARPDARIVVDHYEGMPDLTLRSNVTKRDMLEKNEEERRQCIEAVRKEWEDFEVFLKRTIMTAGGLLPAEARPGQGAGI